MQTHFGWGGIRGEDRVKSLRSAGREGGSNPARGTGARQHCPPLRCPVRRPPLLHCSRAAHRSARIVPHSELQVASCSTASVAWRSLQRPRPRTICARWCLPLHIFIQSALCIEISNRRFPLKQRTRLAEHSLRERRRHGKVASRGLRLCTGSTFTAGVPAVARLFPSVRCARSARHRGHFAAVQRAVRSLESRRHSGLPVAPLRDCSSRCSADRCLSMQGPAPSVRRM